MEGPGKKPRRRCVGCYRNYASIYGSVKAKNITKKVLTYCEKCPNKPALCSHCFLKSHGYLPPRAKVEKPDDTLAKPEKESSSNNPSLEKSNIFEAGDVTFPKFDDEDNQSNPISEQITPNVIHTEFGEKDTETSKTNDPTWNVCVL